MAISRGETTTRPVGRALPTWYDDAKFGIFIHWGPFAIPGFAPVDNDDEVSFTEYYAYWMNVPGSATARFHAREYGDLPYEAFAERFRAGVPLWDPDEWAELFERAGARYVVLTAKTDDGFLLWPSAHPNPRKAGWQVQRDLIGELAAAVRARGLRFGLYYQGIDWAFAPDQPKTRVPQTEEWGAHWRALARADRALRARRPVGGQRLSRFRRPGGPVPLVLRARTGRRRQRPVRPRARRRAVRGGARRLGLAGLPHGRIGAAPGARLHARPARREVGGVPRDGMVLGLQPARQRRDIRARHRARAGADRRRGAQRQPAAERRPDRSRRDPVRPG